MNYRFFIDRPVFSTVLSLLLVLSGAIAYLQLKVREYPNIDEPVVSVRTDYLGASAEIIESQVTQVLEESIAGIAGIETITSSSQSERSNITVRFYLGTDQDNAANDVRDRVGRVRARLPSEIEEPIIAKVEADAQAIINMAFISDRHSVMEISDYVDRFVKDRLQTIPGVSEIRIYGERRYAMRIWLDRARLAAYQLTVQDVEGALRAQNVEIPSGRVESLDREFTVLARTGLRTPAEFERIVVKDANGFQVRVRDVASVALGPTDERRTSRYMGKTAIILGVIKQATANPLDVSKGLRKMLPDLIASLPSGMTAAVTYDSSVFIDRSIAAVYHTVGEAILLVVLVILFFLRSFRATLIPLVTIPVSMIGACTLLLAFGFSINTLTLLAVVLAIGLVVDDAIVVLENVHRHMEHGMSAVRAAVRGINEISGAVMAMTLTLAAVYAPVAFTPGRTGRLFTEFALTLAGAVVVSGFVALTLTPMMCSKLLRGHEKHGRLYMLLERFFEGMTRAYRRSLSGSLKVRPLVLLVGLGVAGASAWFYTNLKAELAPTEDRGVIFTSGTTPEGSTIDFTTRWGQRLERLLVEIPEAAHYFVIAGSRTVNEIISFTALKPWEERTRKAQEITAELRQKLNQVAGARLSANNPGSFGQSARNRPIEFVVRTTESYEKLQEYVDTLLEAARGYQGLINVDTDLRLNKPQLEVDMNREKIADVGVGVATVARTLESLLGGRQVTRFNQNGEQYDVVVQMAPDGRRTQSDVSDIYVRGNGGSMVQLSNLVSIRETVAPKELNRFNQMRAATITANLAPGYAMGDGLTFLENTVREKLPAEVTFDYGGQSRAFKEAGSSLAFIFVLALLFIFLVLSAQFESFVDPFIIMLTVPLSMTGALWALWMTGGTLNVYSQIGLVTLIGLITKHGILIVQFANQLQGEGKPLREAVTEAAVLRLRPILMTTGAMVLGAIPLALAAGAGAESRQQIGWVIVGGLMVGTPLTLYVVPTAYMYLSRARRKREDEEPEPVHGGIAHQPAE